MVIVQAVLYCHLLDWQRYCRLLYWIIDQNSSVPQMFQYHSESNLWLYPNFLTVVQRKIIISYLCWYQALGFFFFFLFLKGLNWRLVTCWHIGLL